ATSFAVHHGKAITANATNQYKMKFIMKSVSPAGVERRCGSHRKLARISPGPGMLLSKRAVCMLVCSCLFASSPVVDGFDTGPAAHRRCPGKATAETDQQQVIPRMKTGSLQELG